MNDHYRLLDNKKWNRRLMNLYWICNALILLAEIVICILLYAGMDLEYSVLEIPPLSEYIRLFMVIPSGAVFLFTAACEITLKTLKGSHEPFQPYAITFTSVAFCAVLMVVHYSVNVIYVTCIMPVFFSLVYNNKRVLSYTFLFSLFVFIGVFGFINLATFPYFRYNFAEITTSAIMLVTAYLVSRIILDRLEEVIVAMMASERLAHESDRAKSRAEASAEARTRFLANVSHEIRTPMNGIIGLSVLALDDETITQKHRNYVRKIKDCADGLLVIINDILDFSKIDAGALTLEHIPFDLRRISEECRTIIASKVDEKGLTLHIRQTGFSGWVVGDPTRLRQALLNLLSNAVKFTEKGSVSLLIHCEPVRNGKTSVYFQIIDTGIGMTSEQYDTVFEPFNQADDSITRHFGGTGLGLSITRHIIELMGGQIKVESAVNIGSRFLFALELAVSDIENPESEWNTMHTDGSVFLGRILLCEDNEINRQVAVENLEKLGLCVVLAENGKECIERVAVCEQENEPFDLILMDIHMPVMGGLEASRKLRDMHVKTPIVAMTANVMPDDQERAVNAGMVDFISKPFKTAALRACLSKYLTLVDEPKTAAAQVSAVTTDDGIRPSVDHVLGLAYAAGNETLYQQIRDRFKTEQPMMFKQIMEAITAEDFILAFHAAHTAKNNAAAIGAFRLAELLTELEEHIKKDAADFDSGILENCHKELSKVLTEV